jgi:hypothetical protein
MQRPLAVFLPRLLLCGLPFLGGCALAAVGVGAAFVTQEFSDNATLAFLHEEPDTVWEQVKQTLGRRSLDKIDADDEQRALRANIGGATVTVQVRRFDATQTRLAVSAKKWGFYDADEANTIITLIKKDLSR